MAGVDYRLVGPRRTGQQAEHVLRGDDFGLRRALDIDPRLQFDRAEVLLACRRFHRLDVEPAIGEQPRRQVALDPAFHRRVIGARIGADDVEHRVGVAVLDRGPAIGCRRGLVDYQHPGSALPRAFLIFIGPTAVIGHRLAAKITLSALEVGVVDQHHQHLALEVLAFEIVPATLGRLDPISDEHQRRFRKIDALVAIGRRADGNFLALGQCDRFPAERHRNLGRGDEFGLEQWHRLGPAALAVDHHPARLETGLGKLVNQISDGLGFARRIGRAPLVGVGAQDPDMFGQPRRVVLRGLSGRGAGGRQCKGGSQSKQARTCHQNLLSVAVTLTRRPAWASGSDIYRTRR